MLRGYNMNGHLTLSLPREFSVLHSPTRVCRYPLFSFSDFFSTPARQGAAPLATGFDGFFKGAYSYHFHNSWYARPAANGESHSLMHSTRWRPFDPVRHWPDLGPRFAEGERAARAAANPDADPDEWVDEIDDDKVDLDWATVLKRTFESHIRGERPNMYGEWLHW
jgi:WD repeat and SOF domain-containing protein 1